MQRPYNRDALRDVNIKYKHSCLTKTEFLHSVPLKRFCALARPEWETSTIFRRKDP